MTWLAVAAAVVGSLAIGFLAGASWMAHRVRAVIKSQGALERHLRSLSRVTR